MKTFPRATLVNASLWAILALSLWMFSRYTVDDAFITWRYGLNLMQSGVWNYNPTPADLSQSYTNPLFAFASILPAAAGIDPVIFFKALSLATMALAYWVLAGRLAVWGRIALLAFLALPATVVHAFAGLETFTFVLCLAGVLISAFEHKKSAAYAWAVVLFFIRPEAWMLAGLLPLYFAVEHGSGAAAGFRPSKIFWPVLKDAVLLSIPVAVFLLLNQSYFGAPLPTAFYVKVGQHIALPNLIWYLALIAVVGGGVAHQCRRPFVILTAVIFGVMAINYAKSDLMMDYAGRFAYHLVAPLFLVANYIQFRVAAQPSNPVVHGGSTVFKTGLAWLPILGLIVFSASYARSTGGTLLYYPKLLNAHAALGDALRKDLPATASISVADAGLIAYESGLNNLDYIGLGSLRVARQGLSSQVFDEYRPEAVMLYVQDDGTLLTGHHQDQMIQWVQSKDFKPLCVVFWSKKASFQVYSKVGLPTVEGVCQSSAQSNGAIDSAGLLKNLQIPPWRYWRAH